MPQTSSRSRELELSTNFHTLIPNNEILFLLGPRAGGAKKGKQATSRSKAKASLCKISF